MKNNLAVIAIENINSAFLFIEVVKLSIDNYNLFVFNIYLLLGLLSLAIRCLLSNLIWYVENFSRGNRGEKWEIVYQNPNFTIILV